MGEKIRHIVKSNILKTVNIYFQDESRYGLQVRPKRILTSKGVKPIQPYQHKFQNSYIYGAFSPLDGDSLLLDLPYCNTEMTQIFLDHLSKKKPEELKILVMDNASFHHSKTLNYPKNIVPLFIPAYSPELNPAERVWQYLKNQVCQKIFPSLEDIQKKMHQVINERLTKERIISLTHNNLYVNVFI